MISTQPAPEPFFHADPHSSTGAAGAGGRVASGAATCTGRSRAAAEATGSPASRLARRCQRCSTLAQMPTRREMAETAPPAIISATRRARTSGACSRRRSLDITTSTRSARTRPGAARVAAAVAATGAATLAARGTGTATVVASEASMTGNLGAADQALKADQTGRLLPWRGAGRRTVVRFPRRIPP